MIYHLHTTYTIACNLYIHQPITTMLHVCDWFQYRRLHRKQASINISISFWRVSLDVLKQQKPFPDWSDVKVVWWWSPINTFNTLMSVRKTEMVLSRLGFTNLTFHNKNKLRYEYWHLWCCCSWEDVFFKRQILYILVKISLLRMSMQFDFIYDGFNQVLLNLT